MSCAERASAPAGRRRSTTPTASASPTSSTGYSLKSCDEVAAAAQFAVHDPVALAVVDQRPDRGRLLCRVAASHPPGNGAVRGDTVRSDLDLRGRAAAEAARAEAGGGDAGARARVIGRELSFVARGGVSARG